MDTKWTKGPWVVAIGDDTDEDYPRGVTVRSEWKPPVKGMCGHEICVMSGGGKFIEHNAHLIAAAPELYDACEMALGAFELNNAIDWELLRTALKKARG